MCLVFLFFQLFRLASIALFLQYMNCAVSNLLLSVCRCCFTTPFLGHTLSADTAHFLFHYSKRYSYRAFLFGYSFDMGSFLPSSFLSVAIFGFYAKFAFLRLAYKYPYMPWWISLGVLTLWITPWFVISATSLMPAGVLADIPICFPRRGVSRLLPIVFYLTYLAFMHGACCAHIEGYQLVLESR
jgi:hypothetical protein